MREFSIEPIRGLPEALPEGERILWQGAPDWRALAQHAFHVRRLTGYFGALLLLQGAVKLWSGAGFAAALVSVLSVAPFAIFAVAVVTVVAWANARATVYTVTNRRVAMRFGVALPMSINLPFARVRSAAFRTHEGGVGDIPLEVEDEAIVSVMVMWPFVRPWKWPAQPMLRAVPEAERVAEILGDALVAGGAARVVVDDEPADVEAPLGAFATAE